MPVMKDSEGQWKDLNVFNYVCIVSRLLLRNGGIGNAEFGCEMTSQQISMVDVYPVLYPNILLAIFKN